MKPDLPYTPDLEKGAFAKINGINTHYHLAGQGPAIVFIHGSGPGVSAWANWRLALPVLQANYTVAALDVVGFGYTERPDNFEFSTKDWADHVISFIEALGVGPVHIVGNSMGGGVALHVAYRRPELVNKIALMGTTGCNFTITDGLATVWAYKPSKENSLQLLNFFVYNKAMATPDLAELRYRASIQPGFQESWEKMFYPNAKGDENPLQWRVDQLALEDEQIASIQAPALVIHGQNDEIIPVANAHKVFELLPTSQLHIFNKCGHWTQIEHAASFNRLLGAFFQD
ncbi:MAG: alpha/beta fold hydrolase [Chloroflexi bacterium]|nr:alpha/beta fold hydrolase [Chloroflexota bacterium]